MSGHSHWSGIKHKKGAKDAKRGALFSKLLAAVAIAARTEPNPQFNPRLRTAVETAKEANVPQENIDRALKRASEKTDLLEELVMEAYGPGGIAILIEAITDSRNRTVSEVKKILSDHEGKWAEPGSVRWAFEGGPRYAEGSGEASKPSEGWRAKFPQAISATDQQKLNTLLEALDEHNDIQDLYTNAN